MAILGYFTGILFEILVATFWYLTGTLFDYSTHYGGKLLRRIFYRNPVTDNLIILFIRVVFLPGLKVVLLVCDLFTMIYFMALGALVSVFNFEEKGEETL